MARYNTAKSLYGACVLSRPPKPAAAPTVAAPVQKYVLLFEEPARPAAPPPEPDPPDAEPPVRVRGFLGDLVNLECGSTQFWMAAGESLHAALIGRAPADLVAGARPWRLVRIERARRRAVFSDGAREVPLCVGGRTD